MNTEGENKIIIPLLGGSREMEIIKDDNYTVLVPSHKPFTLPKEKKFETEDEVMTYLFKEE